MANPSAAARGQPSLGSSTGINLFESTASPMTLPYTAPTGPGSDSSPGMATRVDAASPDPPSKMERDAGNSNGSAPGGRSGGHRPAHRTHTHHPRSSGGFLLQGPLDAPLRPPTHGRPTARREAPAGRAGTGRHTPETPTKNTATERPSALGSALGSPLGSSDKTAPDAADNDLADSPTALDLDSAQIVNMALNLSESRRLAARRAASYQLPPRLAPLPDSSVGGSLRYQLQQQRRASRNLSPRPEKPAPGHRSVSAQSGHAANVGNRISSSSLQAPFEAFSDGAAPSYRYHLSSSTLARAQKARDYLELLAQHRRLLNLIPPLAPPPPLPPSSSAGPDRSGEHRAPAHLGRPYNPLQYIRNRKVRVRERKTIDGSAQGFGDVDKTTEWVDEVERWATTGQGRPPDGALLPAFFSADEAAQQCSPGPPSRIINTAAGTTAKPKRPRVDWAIDPADMIADVYWLEQDDNKKLVEDRHWHRVFSQDPEMYRPLSRRTAAAATDDVFGAMPSPSGVLLPGLRGSGSDLSEQLDAITPLTAALNDGARPGTAIHAPPLDAYHPNHTGSAQASTRGRARQKLRELKGLHHRHNSSIQSDILLRQHRGSFTESSDSENDRRKTRATGRLRSDTVAGAELLQQQMDDLLAKEQRARKDAAATDRIHSRRASDVDLAGPVQSNGKLSQPVDSPMRSGRASLEVPPAGRPTSEYDSSQPTSPEMRPLSREGLGLVPALGGDLSPPGSRPNSPPRHRFSKVRNIFRDHSREHGGPEEKEEEMEAALPDAEPMDAAIMAEPTPTTTSTMPASTADQGPSRSPARQPGSWASAGDVDSRPSHQRTHSNVSSMHSPRHHRGDENSGSGSGSGSGLRALLRSGPRIDTVIRTGVSKVSNIFWRREGEAAEVPSEPTSSDEESEAEAEAEAPQRGRSQLSVDRSRPPSHLGARMEGGLAAEKPGTKHYLDIMPKFISSESSSIRGNMAGDGMQLRVPGAGGDPISRPSSRQSARFERLKPPRIDVQAASPTDSTDGPVLPTQPDEPRESDLSENDSRPRSRLSSIGVGGVSGSGMGVGGTTMVATASVAGSTAAGSGPTGSVAGAQNCRRRPLRRELARVRASLLSSAIVANELSRRAHERRVLMTEAAVERRWNRRGSAGSSDADADDSDINYGSRGPGGNDSSVVVRGNAGETLTWADIAAFGGAEAGLVARRSVAPIELYPVAAQVLGGAVQRSGQAWQATAELFAGSRAVALRQRVDALRTQVAVELSGLASQAADEADEVGRDLVAVRRLQVKHVEDSIEAMLRRRRRRFRWVRRAGWLTVEWVLVGFMWYVWFVVMLARVVLGAFRGVALGVRWLLWL